MHKMLLGPCAFLRNAQTCSERNWNLCKCVDCSHKKCEQKTNLDAKQRFVCLSCPAFSDLWATLVFEQLWYRNSECSGENVAHWKLLYKLKLYRYEFGTSRNSHTNSNSWLHRSCVTHYSLDAGQLDWQAQQRDSLDHSGKARRPGFRIHKFQKLARWFTHSDTEICWLSSADRCWMLQWSKVTKVTEIAGKISFKSHSNLIRFKALPDLQTFANWSEVLGNWARSDDGLRVWGQIWT